MPPSPQLSPLDDGGPVDKTNLLVTEKAVLDAESDQATHETLPLDLFDNAAIFTESRTKKIARSRAFQSRVSKLYMFSCAVCGKGLVSPTGPSEIEAAHIVPRGLKGADDVRNGLALCRSHYWAFDCGLFGVNSHGEISIPAKVAVIAENLDLMSFATHPLKPPSIAGAAPSPAALAWHMTNIVSAHL
jgi:putative restriction endonuclease